MSSSSEEKSQKNPVLTLSYELPRLSCVFFTLSRFLSTCRHPAQPVSVLILHTTVDIQPLVSKHTTQTLHRKCCKVRAQRNAIPSYWIRHAQHTHASNPNTLGERKTGDKQAKKFLRKKMVLTLSYELIVLGVFFHITPFSFYQSTSSTLRVRADSSS